ncbi:MAG: 4Fe-4S dicluster domain-containing protein [Actinobacteria bacterium]|nr:4Fe-4S dicluster domain-containing protein [Actinomycetota bacterium]MBU1943120.1 4Fe-4S dicluster domain-containing protein [Actinomycetota bacterium]MBU2687933.1 4Fe-4S dicluster domain-containing protein [Actinomycetota bacterium]
MAEEKAILVDTTKCTACRACQVACKEWNQNPAEKTKNRGSYENPPTLGSYTWMRILFNEYYKDNKMSWLFTKHQCMHCTDAACVEVCPPNATTHREAKLADGTVVKSVATDPKLCIGCNYCRVACPFDVPGYNQKKKGIYRCTLCVDRQTGDKPGFTVPACVKVCAPGTLSYGNRTELIAKAEARVAQLKAAGYTKARLFGVKELEGLRYMYILTDEPSAYQLPDNPSIPASVKVWKTLTKPYGAFAAGGVLLALILNGIINARNRGLEEKFKLEQ